MQVLGEGQRRSGEREEASETLQLRRVWKSRLFFPKQISSGAGLVCLTDEVDDRVT